MNTQTWTDLIDVDEIDTEDATAVTLGKRHFAIYHTKEGYFVSDSRCTHAGANLCDGYFDGKTIECPLHQGLFDVKTGIARAAPATRNLKMYTCRVHNGKLQVIL